MAGLREFADSPMTSSVGPLAGGEAAQPATLAGLVPVVAASSLVEADAAGRAACRPDRSAVADPLRAAPAAAPAIADPVASPAADSEPSPGAAARSGHAGVLAGLLVLVALPFAAATAYLFTRAADQYHSEVAFSVRSEDTVAAAAGLLGTLTDSATPDTAILRDYIGSQEIVAAVDERLDLRAAWNRPGSGWTDGDPVFSLGDDRSIEALHRQWLRMVSVSHDPAAGTIDVVARAFAPGDARAIAEAILAESGALVNHLSDRAREEAVRLAREELADARARLADVRATLADFRRRHRLVDPSADVAGQSGRLNALNAEVARALVDRDMLTSYAAEDEPRVVRVDRRIAAIRGRIEAERHALGVGGDAGTLPEVVGRYEELSVDLEFAGTAYVQALAGLAAARAEAHRQLRYLAAHVSPTLATTPLYPRRWLLAMITGAVLAFAWGIAALVYWNVRDDR